MSVLRLLFAATGIYGSYLTYGIVQEWIFKHRAADGSKFTFTLTLLLIQCAVNALAALLGNLAMPHSGGPQTLRDGLRYGLPGFSYIAAMLCSNEALKYVSYPTQALGKSCKMVPVMLSSLLFFGARYTALEYLYVALVTGGIYVFRMKDTSGEASSLYGLGLLLASLCLDGVTGPSQDALKRRFRTSVLQPMLYCNLFALVYIAIALATFGEGLAGFQYLAREDNSKLVEFCLIFALCSAVGQNFIFYTLHNFGALPCVTITTTRKFFTILASVVIYGNTISTQQWIAIGMVFSGLSLEIVNKYRKRRAAATAAPQGPDAVVKKDK